MDVASLTKNPQSALPLMSTTAWVIVAVALLVAIVIALLALRWWRRRDKAPPELATPAAPSPPPLAAVMTHDWRAFRAGLPRRARRSLEHFHPVVLLGTEAAGKGELVERFSGVAHRRADLGARAARQDGYLRFALGTDVLVVELSEEVTRAPRDPVEPGLRRALGGLLRRRVPLVVVCLSPESFDKQSEQKLAELGAALRSKIDALAEICGERLSVRVVVADVPGSARLDPLFRLLHLPGVPAVLPLDDGSEDALRARLLGYSHELGAALTTLTPHEALAVVGLLDAAPALARALSLVLGELFADTGEPPPIPDALYLVPATGGPNPLEVPAALARPGPSPLLRHRVIALSLAGAVTAALLAGYRHRASAWTAASSAAWSYQLTADDELDLRAMIRAYTDLEHTGLFDLVTPPFFAEGPEVVACSFVEQVRRDGLIDVLEDQLVVAEQRRRPEEPLYRAALLYATSGDELGRLIADRIDDWSSAVGLAPSLVADYLRLAGPYRDRRWLERLRETARAPADDSIEARLAKLLVALEGGLVGDGSAQDAVVASARSLRVAVADLQRYGAVQRLLATELMAPLAPSFGAHARRFELLAELWESRAGIDAVLRAVVEAALPGAERAVGTYAELVATVGPLLEPAVDRGEQSLVVGHVEYHVDASAAVASLRRTSAERLIAAFLEQPRTDPIDAVVDAVVASAGGTIALPIVPSPGIAVGDRIDRRFTREAFELSVRPTAIALEVILGRLGDRPALRKRLRQQAQAHLAAYAQRYESELEALYASFELDMPSSAAVRRVLRTLAQPASPLRELTRTVAYHAALGIGDDRLLAPFLSIQDRYGPLAAIVDESKGDAPLVAYQDILDEALAGLERPPAAATPGTVSGLTAPAQMALDVLAGADKTPMAQARQWSADNALTAELAAPFLAPLAALQRQGAREIEGSLGALYRELERPLRTDLLSRFPFNATAAIDASPDDVELWLHPTTGRLAVEVLAALDPLFVRKARTSSGRIVYLPSQPCTAPPGCVVVPRALLDVLGTTATLADRLWDEGGKPRPLVVQVTPRPYRSQGRGGPVPELVRLTVGDDGIFYFNQRPVRTALAIDWTQAHGASLSLQLEDEGATALAPPSIETSASPWSLFRLLQKAERRGALHTWRVAVGERAIPISIEVHDPISPLFRGAGSAAAVAAREMP